MSASTTPTTLPQWFSTEVGLPPSFLNAYRLNFPSRTPWTVSLYKAEPLDGAAVHEERGSMKNALWQYQKTNKRSCPGPSYFVLDIGADKLAVPTTWRIPSGTESYGYRFSPLGDLVVSLDNPEHDRIVQGLLREAFKLIFKASVGGPLGSLWQHYNDFCQVPVVEDDADFLFCRHIAVEAVALRDRRWCLQVRLSTQTVDGWTFSDYVRHGKLETLAEWIDLKRRNRLTRKNRPTDVAVLRMQKAPSGVSGDAWTVKRLELDDPDTVIEICRRVAGGNSAVWPANVTCKQFSKGIVSVPPDQLHLILDSQITQEDHRETIIAPSERLKLWKDVRDVLNGADVFGATVRLGDQPVGINEEHSGVIAPPTIRIREAKGEGVLLAPDEVTIETLKLRGQERSAMLKKHGLLQSRPMNPLLACPAGKFNQAQSERLRYDLNAILKNQGLPYRFGRYELYRDVQGIERAVLDGGFDCALVVLPEGRRRAQTSSSMHEKVKRTLAVPSQCIQFDNTFFDRSGRYAIPKTPSDSKPSLPPQIRDLYVSCIWNLAVKNHCVPFAPAESFCYNVHVGIDAGGRDNNKAMLCIGCGLENPRERLVFLAEEIPVQGAKAEPIQVEPLVQGTVGGFEKLAGELKRAGRHFDLGRTLFLRDGPMLGEGERWNERDAFAPILAEAKKRGWVQGEPLWTLVEVSKSAEGWRTLAYDRQVSNPLVGQWTAPFDDPNHVILSTTGAPYLTQGTASPLLVQIRDIYGCSRRENVLRDIVWEADMCFTKPDMGMKLPWVMYVANEGALQAARSYEISGVPV